MTLFYKKFFLIIFGILIAFVVGEMILKMTGYPMYVRDGKTLLKTLKPNFDGYLIKKCLKNRVRVNSVGFHDFEFRQEKPKNIFRIVVVGDSFVEALQVSREKSFYNLLQEKLNNYFGDERKFEVYAFGRAGDGTFMNYVYLKNYALKYHPDLVINAFLPQNDVYDDSYELRKFFGDVPYYLTLFSEFDNTGNVDLTAIEKELTTQKTFRSSIKKIVYKSSLLTWLYTKYRLAYSQLLNKALSEKQVFWKQVFLVDYPEIWQKAWQNEEFLLSSINSLNKQARAKFLLVTLAGAVSAQPENNEEFDYLKPTRLLQEISQRNHFPHFSLAPVFRKRIREEKTAISFSCDGHWNETGHQWAAEAIFEYLVNHPNLISL